MFNRGTLVKYFIILGESNCLLTSGRKLYTNAHRDCPCCHKKRRIKDCRYIQYKTLFGTVVIPSLIKLFGKYYSFWSLASKKDEKFFAKLQTMCYKYSMS